MRPAKPNRACLIAILTVVALGLHSVSGHAQDRSADEQLKDLIPDAAVKAPEAWAQEIDEPAPEQEPVLAQPDALDADSPMRELPSIGVEWPNDLQLDPIEPLDAVALEEEDDPFAELPRLRAENRPEIDLIRIDDRLVLGFPEDADGFPERTDFLARFKALSTIEELGNGDENIAQLSARARVDQDLLQRLMRVYGYYNAQIIRRIGTFGEGGDDPEAEARVRFNIIPGQRYAFGNIDLGSLASAPDAEDLRAAFAIFEGDPLSSDRLVAEQADLDVALGETGYPFAEIADPELLVDHARAEGDLTMPVTPGGKYVFGDVVSEDPNFLSGRHLATISRFNPGEVYQRSLELDLRRAIIATGLVSNATISAREVVPPSGDKPGEIALDVGLQRAKLRTIAGAVGFGSEDGVKLEASWEHRNLFPPEGSLKVRGIAGTQEQLFGVSFKKNNFGKRDQVLLIDAYASDIETQAVAARSVALRGSIERLSNLLFQRPFSWALGAEVLWTDERNRIIGGVSRPREEYLIASTFGRATIDASDSLLDPTEGYRLTGYLAPEVSRSNGTEVYYVRAQADASYYQRVGGSTVLAARGRFATIQGAETFEVAPSRRLYSGGGSSIRGYGYQAVGPRNDFGEPTGGLSQVEFSLEARVDTGLLDGAVQIVPFFDAGSVSISSTPDFRFIQYGAGLGVRYKTGFGPIRVDVAVPLNRNPMFDSPVAVYVSLGQAF